MPKEFAKEDEARMLGATLKRARLGKGLTLVEVQILTNIDCSQVSRLERGLFKTHSKNLQKLMDILQVKRRDAIPLLAAGVHGGLVRRFDSLIRRSSSHLRAAHQMLGVLESFEAENGQGN